MVLSVGHRLRLPRVELRVFFSLGLFHDVSDMENSQRGGQTANVSRSDHAAVLPLAPASEPLPKLSMQTRHITNMPEGHAGSLEACEPQGFGSSAVFSVQETFPTRTNSLNLCRP